MDEHNLTSSGQALPEPEHLLALEKADLKQAEKLWQSLTPAQRMRVLYQAESARDRERLILLDKNAEDIVQNLPPDEFARTIMELGPDDAGSLMELCSDEQLTYVLDLVGWKSERFSPERYQVGLPSVLEMGHQRLERWLLNTDQEVLILLLAHWLKVEKYLPSSEQQEPPDWLPAFTLDGVYFLDFEARAPQELATQILVVLKSEMPDLYMQIMEGLLWEHQEELNEYANRWRQGRMQDNGFPDRSSALELWARPVPGETDWTSKPLKSDIMEKAPPRSSFWSELLPQQETLPTALNEISANCLDELKAELAYIANSGLVALEADPASPAEVIKAARESLSMVNLGLALLANKKPEIAVQILERLPLGAIARHGAQAIRELNQRAASFIKDGWPAKVSTKVLLLDAPLDRWLAGLLFALPRCYDPKAAPGKEYRAFSSPSDLLAASAALDEAEFCGRLYMEDLPWTVDDINQFLAAPAWKSAKDIKFSDILGTWLARRELDLPGLEPLPMAYLPQALEALQPKLISGVYAKQMNEYYLALPPSLALMARKILSAALTRLQQNLTILDPQGLDLDPTNIQGLVVGKHEL